MDVLRPRQPHAAPAASTSTSYAAPHHPSHRHQPHSSSGRRQSACAPPAALSLSLSLPYPPSYHHSHAAASVASLYASLPRHPPLAPPSPSSASSAPMHADNPLSRVLLTVLCHSLANQLRSEGQSMHIPALCTYDDFVRVARGIMQHGRNVQQQEALVRRALNAAIPGGSGLFRVLLGKTGGTSRWAAELNALFATLMFGWLVGDMEWRSTEVEAPPGSGVMREQRSVVHIKKCKYLEASGCVSSCVNLCKAPTQAFFTLEAGIPTTLTPDFETLSCDITFGQVPSPRSEDPAFTAPCFAPSCSKLLGAGLNSGHRAAVLAAAQDVAC